MGRSRSGVSNDNSVPSQEKDDESLLNYNRHTFVHFEFHIRVSTAQISHQKLRRGRELKRVAGGDTLYLTLTLWSPSLLKSSRAGDKERGRKEEQVYHGNSPMQEEKV